MWKSSEAGVAEDQMTGPRWHCGEVVHVTDSNDHECDQAYYNRCTVDVGLYLGYHDVLLKGQFEKLTQKNLNCYQRAKSE